ncbi:MAG: class I SAM-dependent methyltransferase [Gammaproteobacteria bacterium]|nr:MAG: class I SAM-dependent methyltransferase [Gammaproteobacteria bacterium]
MERRPEPAELMNDFSQALAYSEADFAEPHDRFIALFRETFPEFRKSEKVMDLGCGPADITVRFAKAFPQTRIIGLDGAEEMLKLGENRLQTSGLSHRITLIQDTLPLHDSSYPCDTLISNSLLHHLLDPMTLWETIVNICEKGSTLFIMDLMRPDDELTARQMVTQYAAKEPEILQQDFYHSLLAAYTPAEIEVQLDKAGLTHLQIEAVSDRHLIVHGHL